VGKTDAITKWARVRPFARFAKSIPCVIVDFFDHSAEARRHGRQNLEGGSGWSLSCTIADIG